MVVRSVIGWSMSDSQTYEDVTVASHGVTVSKRFEPEEFPVPAIAFRFVSDRDEPVTVELADAVPESVAVEDLGFHPEYGSEHWTIDEDRVTFERELEPDAEYTTVYGIRGTGTDDVDRFLTEPDVATVDPPLSGDTRVDADGADGAAEGDDDLVGDVLADDGEGTESGEEPDEEVETLELADPNDASQSTTGGEESGDVGTPRVGTDDAAGAADVTEADPASADSPDDESETASAGTAPPTADSPDVDEATADAGLAEGDLVASLAAEIRDGEVADEDLEALREALDVDEADGSVRARVQRIQEDVSDLRAYTDALERFLDANGGAEQVVADVRQDVDDLDETVSRIERRVSANDERLSDVEEAVDAFGTDVEELNEWMTDFAEEVSAVSEDVTAAVDDVDRVDTTASALEADLEALEAAVEDLEDRVESGDDVADRVAAIEQDIEELRTWQETIKETFGN